MAGRHPGPVRRREERRVLQLGHRGDEPVARDEHETPRAVRARVLGVDRAVAGAAGQRARPRVAPGDRLALGALGAYIGCRRNNVGFLAFADAAAPAVLIAQALGRWGNWFNNELYGERTDLPWGLVIHQWDNGAGRAVTDASGEPVVLGTFHPTFLYEFVWVLLLAAALLLIDRRRDLARGQLFGLYVAGYPIGRIIIEKMRTDEAELILGQRLNVWTSIVVFLLVVAIVVHTGRRARRKALEPSTM